MMGRYLAAFHQGTSARDIANLTERVRSQRPGLQMIWEQPGCAVFASDDLTPHRLSGGRGIILGQIHERNASASVIPDHVKSRLDHGELDAKVLTKQFWGDFVVLLKAADAAELTVLHAPFGQLPCLYGSTGGFFLVGSDVAALRAAGMPQPPVNPQALARRLAYWELPSHETCLAGIGNLRGGSALVLGAPVPTEREVWSPWAFAGRKNWFETNDQAQRAAHDAILSATRAYQTAKPLLLLSGGLDSSVLAASLASLGGGFTCLNLVHASGTGDERIYARAVAARLGCELLEAEWNLDDVDLTRSHVAGRPDPVGRSFMQGTNAAIASVLEQVGADMVIDGGGGDNVFCNLASVAPVTDALIHGETLVSGWRTAATVARLAQTSAGRVLVKAILRSLRRSPRFRMHPNLAFLSPSAIAAIPTLSPHPWLAVPRRAETGTAAHVAAIAAAQGWAESRDLVSQISHASPLITQPVVEACLRVPSWWWYDGDLNRAVARHAFADRLPEVVIKRRSKGSPDGFIAQIYVNNRTRLREMLLGGRLRQFDLLDLEAVDLATRGAGPLRGTAFHRILQLADAEAWLSVQS